VPAVCGRFLLGAVTLALLIPVVAEAAPRVCQDSADRPIVKPPAAPAGKPAVGASAETTAQPDPARQTPDKPAKPLKVSPPLFPKHRRGLHKNGLGLWVIDATPQSPPLGIDDPGVPENGEYEINLTTFGDFSRDGKQFDLLHVDANYGLLPKFGNRELPTQLKFEVPLSGAKVNGQPMTTGVGDAELGLKLNFYNSAHHSIQVAFYPQIEFAIGSSKLDNGFAEPGQTLIFPLLVSKAMKYATIVVNGGVSTPLHDHDRHVTGTFSFAAGMPVTRKFAVMAELKSETRLDFAHDRLLTANVGLMRALGHRCLLYANVGHSLVSDDGMPHAYAGVGLKVLFKPGPG
jgi:hypothetical protein